MSAFWSQQIMAVRMDSVVNTEFDDVRPYNDEEVGPVLDRLLRDREFLDVILSFKLGAFASLLGFALRPILKAKLLKQAKGVTSVTSLQALIERYLVEAVDKSVTKLSVSGLDDLDPSRSYLFVSNHRDIAMDPAIVNLALFRKGFSTLRIAIGDNLLTKPFTSDLMRLNKCFIVNRSATAPREKLKAAKLLSKYIHYSVVNDNENTWIAQREGRAKDGLDITNSAVMGMILLSRAKKQDLSEYIEEARIVPVSISYEYDPCDKDKARELYVKANEGTYEKGEHEDVDSIAKGITGGKGNVHLSFGTPLRGDLKNTDEVTKEMDRQIIHNYRLHPSNCIAYELLEKKSPKVQVGELLTFFTEEKFSAERKIFMTRLESMDKKYRENYLHAYANPVRAKANH
ncbi:MAG: hypothetical protein ACI93R_002358 [Flavobacteriales bacterium]|jgi:hypothetical protein